MNWIGRKIHLYNVSIGLYMLDWWERYLFNILMICLAWHILWYLVGFFQSNLKIVLQGAIVEIVVGTIYADGLQCIPCNFIRSVRSQPRIKRRIVWILLLMCSRL